MFRGTEPLYKAVAEYESLELHLDSIADGLAKGAGDTGGAQALLWRPYMEDVRRMLGGLQKKRKLGYHPSSIEASALLSDVSSLTAGVQGLMGRVRAENGPPVDHSRSLVGKAVDHARKLLAATNRLADEAAGRQMRLEMKRRAQQDRRNEKNPSYAATRKLRDAIKEFNKGIGKELTLESLERWESRPQFDADDSDQVRRVAEIYMLELMDGQEFEVRARSDRPGRPLVCLDISVTFPNEEQVAFGEQFHEPYAEYLIAAKLPRWKVVWKYSGRAW